MSMVDHLNNRHCDYKGFEVRIHVTALYFIFERRDNDKRITIPRREINYRLTDDIINKVFDELFHDSAR